MNRVQELLLPCVQDTFGELLLTLLDLQSVKCGILRLQVSPIQWRGSSVSVIDRLDLNRDLTLSELTRSRKGTRTGPGVLSPVVDVSTS